MTDQPKIFITLPCYTGIQSNCVRSILALTKTLREASIPSMLYTVDAIAMISEVRNLMAAHFLASDATHMLMIDSDIGFTPQTVMKLLEKGKDFTCAAAPKHAIDTKKIARAAELQYPHPEKFGAIFSAVPLPDQATDDGWVRLDRVATNLMLLSRKVFDDIREQNVIDVGAFAARICQAAGVDAESLPEEQQNKILAIASGDGGPFLRYKQTQEGHPDMEMFGYFTPQIMDGRMKWDDTSFCMRWRRTGGEIWCCMDADISHTGVSVHSANLWKLRSAVAERNAG